MSALQRRYGHAKSKGSKLTPEQVEFLTSQVRGSTPASWRSEWVDGALPDGRAVKLKSTHRNGTHFIAIKLPVRLKFEGRDAGSAIDHFSLNVSTGVLTQR